MTHDELLESAASESADRGGSSIAALLAVIKLHAPIASLSKEGSFYCGECGVYDELCESLKVIALELK